MPVPWERESRIHHTNAATPPQHSRGQPARLHYLDWLRVLAILGVFLFHTTRPFDLQDFEIKNATRSLAVMALGLFPFQWGMPLVFLLAGASSWHALQRRTSRQYIIDRARRLMVPYIILGVLTLTPMQVYLGMVHKGEYRGPFLEFGPTYIASRAGPSWSELLNPMVFESYGHHLWFLGFLFVYSLIALPIFLWLKKEAGRRFVVRLGSLVETRGTILVPLIPLVLVRFLLQPLYPGHTDWADFFFMLVFFISGYVLYADERFTRAIRRDWKLVLTLAIACSVVGYLCYLAGLAETWAYSPGTVGFYIIWCVLSAVSVCWVIIVLYASMRLLDFRNKWLEYGLDAVMPFYVFHHPAIIAIAFFVVQWDTSAWLPSTTPFDGLRVQLRAGGASGGILVKLLVVALGSFVGSIGLYEVGIRRIGVARALFGMKPLRRQATHWEAE